EPEKATRMKAFTAPEGWRRADGFFAYDRVKSVTRTLMRETVAIELESPHTHVTAGLVTHNTGIEQFNIGYVTFTLMAHLVRWEQAIRRDLILAPQTFFAKFIVDGLLRGASEARAAFYASAITNGWMTRNEVRELEDMNTVDGLDEFLVPQNMAEVGEDGKVTPINKILPDSDRGREASAGDRARLLAHEAAARVVRKEQAAVLSAAAFASIFAVVDFIYQRFDPFLAAFAYTRLGVGVVALILLVVLMLPGSSQGSTRRDTQAQKMTLTIAVAFFGSKLLAAGALILQNYAISLGSVTVVNALQGTQYLVLLILAVAVTRFAPRLFREELSRVVLWQKVSGIVLIGLGLVLLVSVR
ncbi:phage portal protein, partial [Patescibacteria group bacterium]|nr:phage portal protein [Patescibacteria group bacterium]